MKSTVVPLAEPMTLNTANGPVHVDEQVSFELPELHGDTVQAVVMGDTPRVLSVGERCRNQGYTFVWPSGSSPYFLTSRGATIQCEVHGNVPYVRTLRPALAAPASSSSGLPRATGPPVAAEVQDDDVASGAERRDLKAEAISLQHLLTHKPKNPWCTTCSRAKATRRPCRRKSAFGAPPEHFGDQVTADHVIAHSERSQGVTGDRAAVVVQDRGTRFLAGYPVDSKASKDAQACLMHFFGTASVKQVYTDNSPELIATVAAMRILNPTAVQGRPQTNGVAERAVREVMEGTRCALLQAGMPPGLWPYAMRHFSTAYNLLVDEDGSSPWLRRHGSEFPALRLPFGCLVDFIPEQVGPEDRPKAAPRAIPGVFMGWKLQPGFTWGHAYRVTDLRAFQGLDFSIWGSSGDVRVHTVGELVAPRENYKFPLVERYEAANRTLSADRVDPPSEPEPVVEDNEIDSGAEIDDDEPIQIGEGTQDEWTFPDGRIVRVIRSPRDSHYVPDNFSLVSVHGPVRDKLSSRRVTTMVFDGGAMVKKEDDWRSALEDPPARLEKSWTGTVEFFRKDDLAYGPDEDPLRDAYDENFWRDSSGQFWVRDSIGRKYRSDCFGVRERKDSRRPAHFLTKEWQGFSEERKELEYRKAIAEANGDESLMPPKARRIAESDAPVPGGSASSSSAVPAPTPPPREVHVAPAMPVIVRNRRQRRHREKIPKSALPFSACVARPVKKGEIDSTPAARAAMDVEWNKLRTKKHRLLAAPGCWDESEVREMSDVRAEARRLNKVVHFGTIFGICVEKGSELPSGDPRRKYKGRYVFRGNDVKDQNWQAAMFQELGSSPAAIEAGKSADFYGLIPGHATEQSDAEQAYTQSILEGTETWVMLPRDRWPPSWHGMRNPVCPLRLALYGHPDSGGFWERHCEAHVKSVGFEPITDWRSCFWHPVLKLFLVVYVDDFKLSGPVGSLPEGWRLLRGGLEMEEPHPQGLFLGCHHRESVQTSPLTGSAVRVMEYDMEDFLRSCIALYTELSGQTTFRKATTPFLEDLDPDLDPNSGGPILSDHGGTTLSLPEGGENDWNYSRSATVPGDEPRGELADVASRILMKFIYAARIARYDILHSIQRLACRMTSWSVHCDKMLYRLVCYVHGTLSLRCVGWVGDDADSIGVHLYADADFAGCKKSKRSTSGAFFCLLGPDTLYPIQAVSKKQTAVSHSTPEAEIVATDLAVRTVGTPALSLWDTLLQREVVMQFHEDNAAMIQVCRTGRNPTMRHLGRTHKVDVQWLHERFAEPYYNLLYEPTLGMRADIFTKGFVDSDKWRHALDLISHVFPEECWQFPHPRLLPPEHGTGGNQDTTAVEALPQVAAPVQLRLQQQQVFPSGVKHGDSFEFSNKRKKRVQALLDATTFPVNRRTVTPGLGTCVGSTYDTSGPRIGGHTAKMSRLIMAINDALEKTLEGIPFRWGSLQLNQNTVSRLHTDKNNIGHSVIFLMGHFAGGTFHVDNETLSLTETGRCLIIDGTRPHYSDPFQGTRYSVVAFYHGSTPFLPPLELERLRKLGFRLEYPGETPLVSILDHRAPTRLDPALPAREQLLDFDRVLIEWCCGEDSLLGRHTPASLGCRSYRLTIDHDLRSADGVDHAMRIIDQSISDAGSRILLWCAIPCTGGSPWQRINAARGSATRKRIAQHKVDFKSLWDNFVPCALRVLKAGGSVSIEWPQQCEYWRDDSVTSFLAQQPFRGTLVHGCMLDLKATSGPNVGRPIKKPWIVQSTMSSLGPYLGVVCDKSHLHARCAGADTRLSESYTEEFVKRVHLAFAQHCRSL